MVRDRSCSSESEAFPVTFSKPGFVNFVGAVFRQRVGLNVDATRAFVTSKVVAAVSYYALRVQRAANLCHDDRMHGFSPFFVWRAKDGTFENVWMTIDDVFDLR